MRILAGYIPLIQLKRAFVLMLNRTSLDYSTTRIRAHPRSRARTETGRENRALSPPLTRLFKFFRCPPERCQETAQSVLREQESLLPTLQPRLHPEEEHDAASTPRVWHGAQVPVPVLRQALQIHAKHLCAHPKVSSWSGLVLQAIVLSDHRTWRPSSFIHLRSLPFQPSFVTRKMQKVKIALV